MGIANRSFGRRSLSSPELVLTTAGILLVVLAVVFFLLVSSQIWNTWSFLNGMYINIVIQFFGYWAIGAYSLLIIAYSAASFRPYKFDMLLFTMRFLGNMVVLFIVLDFILLVLSPLIWASFFLIGGAIAAYFIIQGSKFRTRVRVTRGTSSSFLVGKSERLRVPVGGKVELLVAGAGVSDFGVGLESNEKIDTQNLSKSPGESQWEAGIIPFSELPSTVTVLYKRNRIQKFTLEKEETKWITHLTVDVVVDGTVRLHDGEVSMKLPVDQSIRRIVDKVVDTYGDYFVGASRAKLRVYQENRELLLDRSIYENGLSDDTKIEVHTT